MADLKYSLSILFNAPWIFATVCTNGFDWISPDKPKTAVVKRALPQYPAGNGGFNLDRPSVGMCNFVAWSFEIPRALQVHCQICAARVSKVL